MAMVVMGDMCVQSHYILTHIQITINHKYTHTHTHVTLNTTHAQTRRRGLFVSPALPLLHDGHGVNPWWALECSQLHLFQSSSTQLVCLALLLLLLLLLVGGVLRSLNGGCWLARGIRGGEGGGREGVGHTDCHTLGR